MTSSTPADLLREWIESLDGDEARELLLGAAMRSGEAFSWLDGLRVAGSEDPDDLLNLVNRELKPTRRFYDYWQANEYAEECAPTVQLLLDAARDARPALVPIIERAITLLTRAILRADDSSGLLGQLVEETLEAHALAVRSSTPPLTVAEQKRLVKWIVKYRYHGEQDFFDPDIVAYAPGLSEASIAQYRTAIETLDLGDYGRYPLTRLAVLRGDRDEIVAANGGEPHNELVAERLVNDLTEAGLRDHALHYARLGVEMAGRGWHTQLIDLLVDDALDRGATSAAALGESVQLRRDWFARFPSAQSFNALHTTALRVGVWDDERAAAEAVLADHSPNDFTRYLLSARPDEAWEYALQHLPLRVSEQKIEIPPDASPARRAMLTALQRPQHTLLDRQLWSDLCKQRESGHPADALPVYRALIDEVLVETDKRNYREAAKLLTRMRSVADQAGGSAPAEFAQFLADTADRNRRRPTCIAAFKRAGLLS